MIDLEEAEQLQAFARLGTLSRVAEEHRISTPSVTRAMQHLEEAFGVPLFTRGKNKIELNETGKLAAELCGRLLQQAGQTVRQVQEFDQRQKTIVICACAPAPLWEWQHRLNTEKPGVMVSSKIEQNEEVLADWQNGRCDIAILPFPFEGAKCFMQENLFVCVPPEHELAQRKSLRFADINGFNFLLRTELGFWDALCRRKMPASKFLVQNDPEVFSELVKASSLPCFATDYNNLKGAYPNRVNIPLEDPEAHITFYAAERKKNTAGKNA